MSDEIAGNDGTSPERFLYLLVNPRLRRFVAAARSHGWEARPSAVAPDCIIVDSPSGRDQFVLYPSGYKRTASLVVYDGRDGNEFSPIPARTARAFIADHGIHS